MLEVLFGRRETKTTEQRVLVAKDRFQLLHVSLLRSLAHWLLSFLVLCAFSVPPRLRTEAF